MMDDGDGMGGYSMGGSSYLKTKARARSLPQILISQLLWYGSKPSLRLRQTD
jgi:hypothetical protein